MQMGYFLFHKIGTEFFKILLEIESNLVLAGRIESSPQGNQRLNPTPPAKTKPAS